MEIRIVNLTPHSITFIGEVGNLVIEPSGVVARVSTETVTIGEINGIPVTETKFGQIEGLPAPCEGTVFLVSSLVAQRCKERLDVFIPNESVRDSEGKIVGCKSFGRV